MIKAVINTQKYFQAPKNYFWQWTDNADVIEWKDGRTICYQRELAFILKEVASYGLPPLNVVLLICAASLVEYNEAQSIGMLNGILQSLPPCKPDESSDEVLKYHLEQAQKFLHIVSNLPHELKRRQKTSHLLFEVFGKQKFAINSTNLNDAVDELLSGRMQHLLNIKGDAITRHQLKTDLSYLSDALQRFPTVESIELRLRTGIDKLPEAIEIAPIESVADVDLLKELEEDNKTIGVARLARHIIAALNIPMHSQGSSDQPLGGISDITNRGNYDKLLLSELAYDDDALMARLVNNEALYLRREQPPENPQRKRTILLDTTLKMWGLPRVFALSVAIACSRNTKHKETIEAFALAGETYQTIQLDTKEGIIQTLETLQHALHCGKALQAVASNVNNVKNNELFFITEASLLHSAAFHAPLAIVKESLSFILTVNRNGELALYQSIKGKTQLLSTARFDLDELLFKGKIKPFKLNKANEDLPYFIDAHPAPLLYPPTRIVNSNERTFYLNDIGIIAITENNRVLHIAKAGKAAVELMNYIETGEYTVGAFGTGAVIMVNSRDKKQLKLYKIDIEGGSYKYDIMPLEISIAKKIVFKTRDNHFYIQTQNDIIRLNVNTLDYNGMKPNSFSHKMPDSDLVDIRTVFLQHIQYENIFTNIKSIFINDKGKLAFGKHYLDVRDTHTIKIIESEGLVTELNTSSTYDDDFRPLPNKKIRFRKLTWNDGSEAIVDSRGLLHLRSSDTTIPEITLVLILTKSTACWASDGTTCGLTYFINEQHSRRITVSSFYQNNIQRFINQIKAS
jgi:hypothetical protein